MLDVPPFARNARLAERVRGLMVRRGWIPVRSRHPTGKGHAARVGYARLADDAKVPTSPNGSYCLVAPSKCSVPTAHGRHPKVPAVQRGLFDPAAYRHARTRAGKRKPLRERTTEYSQTIDALQYASGGASWDERSHRRQIRRAWSGRRHAQVGGVDLVTPSRGIVVAAVSKNQQDDNECHDKRPRSERRRDVGPATLTSSPWSSWARCSGRGSG